FINDPTRDNASYPQRPKAFINYIFFDEQFKMVSGGASPVNPTGFIKDHFSDLQNLAAIKNGYLYVYVSNESPVNVFFDNLQLIHTRGALLEETHYYPFGLTMAGISNSTINIPTKNNCGCPNKNGFNGNEIQSREFSGTIGLELYDFNARTYDPQMARFIQSDPLGEEAGQESLSSYHFGFNNPVRYEDADGKCPICPFIVWGMRAYRAYKTFQVLEKVTTVSKASIHSPPAAAVIMTPMIITTDAQGQTVSVPESKIKEFETQVRIEKTEEIDKEIISLEKANRSLERRASEHEQKLKDFKNDPDKNDNKGYLKDQSPELRKKIIEKRVKNLETEIRSFRNNIKKNEKKIEGLKDEKQKITATK
ncbi:RHS repeat-associated core domain-containing protein, partial [Terrimonas ferruginea]|uniref:RHS repeat-associated core domain-containing protein n=1 Tax=Terrimonas ferruginea TaxID=249 RepID=UPI00048E90AA